MNFPVFKGPPVPVTLNLPHVSHGFLCHHLSFHIPHSCYPNLKLSKANVLVPRHILYPGEILTIDYSTLFLGRGNFGLCNCGFNGCRKRVLGFNFLPVIFQNKYLEEDAVPAFIRDMVVH